MDNLSIIDQQVSKDYLNDEDTFLNTLQDLPDSSLRLKDPTFEEGVDSSQILQPP